jgi:hypothetical protein
VTPHNQSFHQFRETHLPDSKWVFVFWITGIIAQLGGLPMSTETNSYKISLDTWAVALGLALAVLIRLGILKGIPW